MNIVSNSYFLRKLRNLSFFKLDLGKSKKIVNDDNNRFRKLTEFQIKYHNLYNNDIMDFGTIANKIIFFEDVCIKGNKILIFKDSNIYEIVWTEEETIDIENYILNVLRKIDSSEETEENIEEENIKKVEEYANTNDVWVDPKSSKKYIIDQTLSKEEYRKKIMEKIKNP